MNLGLRFLSGNVRISPKRVNLLAEYRNLISDGKLIAYRPISNHTTQQVKGSAFTGAGSATATGLLTTDVITAGGGTAPTCSVDGTLTISADCWGIYVHRDGVLWAYWPGINVGATFEIDASGNDHHLYLTTTTITERLDGTGTSWANEMGFTVADGTQYLDALAVDLVGIGWRIPSLIDGSGAASWSGTTDTLEMVPGLVMLATLEMR